MKIVAILLIFIQILSANSLKEKCNSGDTKSCTLLGLEYFKVGKYSKAIKLLKISCNNNMAETCGLLGSIYDEGRGVDVDLDKSIYFYQKGCDLNYTKSCSNLSNIYRKKGMFKKAFHIDKESCNTKKSKGSCYNIGKYYLDGKYVEGNLTKALQYYKLSCKYGAKKACKIYNFLHIEKNINANLKQNNIVKLPFTKCVKKGFKMPIYNATMNYIYKQDNKTTKMMEFEFNQKIPKDIKLAIGSEKNCTIKSFKTKNYLSKNGYKTIIEFGYKTSNIKNIVSAYAKKDTNSYFLLSKKQKIKSYGAKTIVIYYDKKVKKDRVTIFTKDGKIHNFMIYFN